MVFVQLKIGLLVCSIINCAPKPDTNNATGALAPQGSTSDLDIKVMCTLPGTVVNWADDTCTTYIMCIPGMEGYLQATITRCPNNFIYNDLEGRCVARDSSSSSNYTCPMPCKNKEGRFTNPWDRCDGYLFCSRNVDGKLVAHVMSCPPGTTFDADTTTCTAEAYETTCKLNSTTTITTESTTVGDSSIITGSTTRESSSTTLEPVTCSKEGRYVDPTGPCTGYILCVADIDGNLIGHRLNCPEGSWFFPKMRRCILGYDESRCNPTTKTTTISTTTEAVVSTNKREQTIKPEWCKEEGRFIDPGSPCDGYMRCTRDPVDGVLYGVHYDCPVSTWFHEETRNCEGEVPLRCYSSSSTEFTQSTSEVSSEGSSTVSQKASESSEAPTSSSILSTDSTRPGTIGPPVVCTREGKFVDPEAPCTQYILCVSKESGSIVGERYLCPRGTTFLEERGRCVLMECNIPPSPSTTTLWLSSTDGFESSPEPSTPSEINSSHPESSQNYGSTQYTSSSAAPESSISDEQDSSTTSAAPESEVPQTSSTNDPQSSTLSEISSSHPESTQYTSSSPAPGSSMSDESSSKGSHSTISFSFEQGSSSTFAAPESEVAQTSSTDDLQTSQGTETSGPESSASTDPTVSRSGDTSLQTENNQKTSEVDSSNQPEPTPQATETSSKPSTASVSSNLESSTQPTSNSPNPSSSRPKSSLTNPSSEVTDSTLGQTESQTDREDTSSTAQPSEIPNQSSREPTESFDRIEWISIPPSNLESSPSEPKPDLSSSIESTPTTPAEVTSETDITDPAEFECQAEGRFAIPDICNRYILCSLTLEGTYQMTFHRCPPRTVFSPMRSRCFTI